jgi:hypothetical protein
VSLGELRGGELIALANRTVPFPLACRVIGMDNVPEPRDSGSRAYCPFGEFSHPDGGRDQALRVYYDHGFCVDAETEILTQRGWLRMGSVRASDIALTYRDGGTRWEPLEAVYRFSAARRRMLSMETKTHSSLTTGDHRWLVRRQAAEPSGRPRNGCEVPSPWERFTTSAEGFRSNDHVPYIGGPCVTLPDQAKHSDAFVELVAWFFTEGQVHPGGYLVISQSHEVNPGNCARIRAALTVCFGPPSDTIRTTHRWREAVRTRGKTDFIISSRLASLFLAEAPDKVVRPEFIVSLTRPQLLLFIDAAMAADGSRIGNWAQLCQARRDRLDAFQIALLLTGTPARIWQRSPTGSRQGQKIQDWACQLLQSRHFQPGRNPGKLNWVWHDGPVWCVQTPSGTWVARRRGTVYVTGNCFAEWLYLSPVKLLVLAQELAPEEAARQLLDRIGYRPASWLERWDELQDEQPEPDYASLARALRTHLEVRYPDWGNRQLDSYVSTTLARCLGLLTRVHSEADCKLWLERSSEVMARALGG